MERGRTSMAGHFGSSKRGRIAQVVEDVIRRHDLGEAIDDHDVIDIHPGLMPELGDRLRALRRIERAEQRAHATVVGRHHLDDDDGADAFGLILADSLPGYEVFEEIHRGGQGVVYRAVQKATRRVVAIKVVREGPFLGPRDKGRFDREVRILAQLKHPNIVTIHDSGTAMGSHYFVMDYVAGCALDEYVVGHCRTIDAALVLFAKICEAVSAAHLRGIIHRDHKPSNIRVDEYGEPHVLDFGLAKFDADHDEGVPARAMTITGQFVGSLPWSSPEQAEGTPGQIDLRTDVYSLGVVLYQMLTGRFPYEVAGKLRDVFDRILEADPVKPSRLRKEIDGEIETIVLKCLAKRPDERYQSAMAVSEDIERFLSHQPITARPPSLGYLGRKFIRRHRIGFAFSVMLALGVVGVAIRMSGLYHESERQATTTRAVQSFLTQKLFGSMNPSVSRGREPTVREILGDGARSVRSAFEDQPIVRASLLSMLGQVYHSLDETPTAREMLREAEAIQARLLGEAHRDTIRTRMALVSTLGTPELLNESEALATRNSAVCRATFGEADRLTLATRMAYSGALWRAQRRDEAIRFDLETLELCRRYLGDDDATTIAAWIKVVDPGLRSLGRADEAEDQARQILAQCERLHGSEHPQTISAMGMLAWNIMDRGKLNEAEFLFRKRYEMHVRYYGADHSATLNAAMQIALLLRTSQRVDEAESLYREIIETGRAVLGADDPIVMTAMQYHASVLRRLERNAEAIEVFGQLLDARTRIYGADDVATATALTCLSNMYVKLGYMREAVPGLRIAYDVISRRVGAGQVHTLWPLRSLVRCLFALGEEDEARPLAEELLLRRRLAAEVGVRSPRPKYEYARALLTTPFEGLRDAELAVSVAEEASSLVPDAYRPDDYWLALAYHDAGDVEAAVATLEQLLAAAPVSGSTDRDNFEKKLVSYYRELGDVEAAEDRLRDTLAARREAFAADAPCVADSLVRLGEFLTEHERMEEAVPLLSEGLEIRRAQAPPNAWSEGIACVSHGSALLKMDRPREAEPLLLEGFSLLSEGDYAPATQRDRALAELVELYTVLNMPAKALEFSVLRDSQSATLE